MSSISSDSLFHFTPSADNLIGILTKEFLPRFCCEEITLEGEETTSFIKHAFPMVCFCDIPLSQIKNHINTYGCYGLGMSKTWGITKRLNPVVYLNKTSTFSHSLYKTLKMSAKMNKNQEVATKELSETIGETLRYLKPYSGNFERNGKAIKYVKFYNEREWRYVPKYSFKDGSWAITKEEYNNPVTRAQENTATEGAKLSFEPSDIKYIIVKEEKEILSMIVALRKIKKKYDANTIEILTSRIITSEQILNDL